MRHPRSILCLLLAAHMLIGCAQTSQTISVSSKDGSTMDSKTPAFTVQVLYFDGCPNTPPMQSAVETAVARLGESWAIELIDLEALPADDMRRGYGSPTILVDGVDPFGAPPPTSPSMSCRHYADGLPTADQIRDRLLALKFGEAGR